MNTGVQKMRLLELWLSQGICPVVGLLGHMADLFRVLWIFTLEYHFNGAIKMDQKHPQTGFTILELTDFSGDKHF